MVSCLVGLGTNLGDRAATLERALAALDDLPSVTLGAHSRWYESSPIGGPPQNPYLNGAVVVSTTLPPSDLLARLLEIENQLGRRREVRWGARTIDLDLLLYGDQTIELPQLTVPHPRFAFRRFALAPAAEIAGSWRHPTVGWTVERLLAHAEHALPYVAITGLPESGQTTLAQAVARQVNGAFIASAGEPRLDSGPSGASDPAGLGSLRVIRSLEECERRVPHGPWPHPVSPVISDFWWEAWLAWAKAVLSPAEYDAMETRGEQLLEQVVPPKLLVFLETNGPAMALPQNLATAYAQALRCRSTRPGRGPVLRLNTTDEPTRQAEVVAAILAMQSPVVAV